MHGYKTLERKDQLQPIRNKISIPSKTNSKLEKDTLWNQMSRAIGESIPKNKSKCSSL